MPWNKETGWTVSTPEEAHRRYYDACVELKIFSGTYEEFRQGKYGALYYSPSQQDTRQEIELAMIFEKMKDFYRQSNALIRTNNLNPAEIQNAFKTQLGLDVALDQNTQNWAMAVDYTPSSDSNKKIAKLLAEECFAYGVPMIGAIEQAHQVAEGKQAFTMKWEQATNQSLEYKVTITTVSTNSSPELTKDEIRKIFLDNHAKRIVWGNIIEPQIILNETDLGFAASVEIEVKKEEDPDSSYQKTPLKIPYTKKPVPILDPKNITITNVTPT